MYFWRTVLLESSFKSFSIASFDVLEKRFSSASGLSIVFFRFQQRHAAIILSYTAVLEQINI